VKFGTPTPIGILHEPGWQPRNVPGLPASVDSDLNLN
jgi:hypothetical protein